MKAPIEHEDLKTAIELLGGQKAVSDRFEIPYRTVQNWYRGERTPPAYVARMIIEVERAEAKEQESFDNMVFANLEKKEAERAAEDVAAVQEQLSNEKTVEIWKLKDKVESQKETIDFLESEVEALKSSVDELLEKSEWYKAELEKQKKARETWVRQAGTLTR